MYFIYCRFAVSCVFSRASSKWYRPGGRLSVAQYEAEGDEYTRKALEDLHATTTEDWGAVKKKVLSVWIGSFWEIRGLANLAG